jgi:hypothetical protein
MRGAPCRKGVTVQLPLPEFLESPPPPGSGAPVWSTLDDEHRAVVVAMVARLIAKLVAGHGAPPAAAEQEADHA